ncbi:MAG: glycosyltransferase [Kineosporiaceae bacterium]
MSELSSALRPAHVSDAPPTAVGVLDVEAPTAVRFPVTPIAARHQRLRVMVRRGRRPLGFVEIAAAAGTWDPIALAEQVEALVGPAAGPAPTVLAEPDPMTVVVCTRDRAELLRRSLTSILDQASGRTELVVVDNAPRTSATRDVVEALDDARIRYVLEPRPGLSVARNVGMAHASHELVAFTDDDVVADPDWLVGLSAAARHGDAGCLTGSVPTGQLESAVQHFFERRVDWSGQLEPQLFRRQDTHRGPLYPFSPGIFGTGANFAITRSAYRRVGPFDERLGAGRRTKGGEDLDYFFRLIWAGIGIRYEPSAMVWHIHRPDEAAYRDQVLGYGIGYGAFATKLALSPRWAGSFARRVPRGAWLLRRAMKTAVDGHGLPPEFTRLERRGMMRGPIELAREHLAGLNGTGGRR